MFGQYYASELAYLREMGKELGRTNPAMASALSEGSGDPDVERLLEGFAFLAAQIRGRTEAAYPDLMDAIADQLAPTLVRPIPAATVLELRPRVRTMRSLQKIPAGTEFGSRPVDGVNCIFRSTEDCEVLPVELGRCEIDRTRSVAPVLKTALEFAEHGRGALLESKKLTFYIAGPWTSASLFVYWLKMHLRQVRLSGGADALVLPKTALRIRPDGVKELSRGLYPWPSLAPDGIRWLREYFQIPTAFLFFELDLSVARESHLGLNTQIEFHFDGDPPGLPEAIPPDFLRIHCVPTTNLFDADAEPITVDPMRRDYWLRASGLRPEQADVFAIRRMTGLRSRRTGRIDYEPVYSPRLLDRQEDSYRLRRVRSPLDGALDTHVVFARPQRIQDGEEIVSLELTCTNRLLPTALRQGDVCVSLPSSPSSMAFANVTGVSKPFAPPVGEALQWALLRELSASRRSVLDVESLRARLSIHNVQRDLDRPLGEANDRKIQGILSTKSRAITSVFRGMRVRGVETELELDANAFASLGDAHFFATGLDILFSSHLPLNSFHRLRVRLAPTGREWTFEPRTGLRSIL